MTHTLSFLPMLTGLQHLLSRSSLEVDGPQADFLHYGSNLHRLLAVNEYQKSGLIFCNRYHAEFAGPGALLGFGLEPQVHSIVAIGLPEVIEVVTPEARQRAYGRKIQWTRWLQKITKYPQPRDRAEKLLCGLEAFFGRSIVQDLPIDVLALLVGVLPSTIVQARSQNYLSVPASEDKAADQESSIVVIRNVQTLQSFSTTSTPFIVSEPLSQGAFAIPWSA
ncbi:MAG TPA: hypothetical protein V6D18_00670 [Thermosynechococcaceae cyanobacterium]